MFVGLSEIMFLIPNFDSDRHSKQPIGNHSVGKLSTKRQVQEANSHEYSNDADSGAIDCDAP